MPHHNYPFFVMITVTLQRLVPKVTSIHFEYPNRNFVNPVPKLKQNAKIKHAVMYLTLTLYSLRFILIYTLWHFTLFTNCTLTLVCDLYVNKNIVMWDLVRFVLVCILLICTFYDFYKYKTKDILLCPQSFTLTCVKSVSV